MILGNFVVARLYSSAVRIYGYPGDGDRNYRLIWSAACSSGRRCRRGAARANQWLYCM